MKNIKYKLIIILLVSVLFNGCGSKDPEDIFKDFTILSDFYKIKGKENINERS